MYSTPRATFRRSRIVCALATGALLATTAACGGGATGAAGSDASSPAPTDQPAAAVTTAAPAPTTDSAAAGDPAAEPVVAHHAHHVAPIRNVVTISTPGMRYVVRGHLRPGVAAITLRNTDDEAHMMAISRLKPGVTLKDVKAALKKGEQAIPPLLADGPDAAYGTPSLVGAGASSTVTAPKLPAGTYVLICFLTDAHGMPHFMMGMIGTMKVKGTRQSVKPASRGTIAISDKGIRLPKSFTGRGTYLVKDVGKKPHNLSFARLSKGTSLKAYAGYVGQAMNTGKPVDGGGGLLEGGVDALNPGGTAWVTLHLRRGHYGYISTEDITGPTLPPQHGEFDVR